ncbi:MAG: SGNH/GDSL hydrolase family protein [Elusimicrobiota bacterium]
MYKFRPSIINTLIFAFFATTTLPAINAAMVSNDPEIYAEQPSDFDVTVSSPDFTKSKYKALRWVNPRTDDNCQMKVCGLAWFDKQKTYHRMPTDPKYNLPSAVVNRATFGSGTQVRFRTDSRKLVVRVRLNRLATNPQMAYSGQNGVDCYFGTPGTTEKEGMQFISTARFGIKNTWYESVMYELKESKLRDVTLYLPISTHVEDFMVGLDSTAVIEPPLPYDSNKQIVFYGTSITQGHNVSRPGMTFTSILSRRINYEIINVGFGGSGKGEPEVAHALAEISPVAMYVLDYERNVGTVESYQKTLPEFINILRTAHKDIPIIVTSCPKVPKDYVNGTAAPLATKKREFGISHIKELQNAGDKFIWFVDGMTYFGNSAADCTTDGLHPNDYGSVRIADVLCPEIKRVLDLK